MVGPAGDELARVYKIRDPYTARRGEMRGKETGDEYGEMEKGREEKEKGKQAARNGCDIAQPGCLRATDSEFHQSPHRCHFSKDSL